MRDNAIIMLSIYYHHFPPMTSYKVNRFVSRGHYRYRRQYSTPTKRTPPFATEVVVFLSYE